MHNKLKKINDCLICEVDRQLACLEEVDTEELGEVIDMIKDVEEAIYYHTITKSMTEDSYKNEHTMYYVEPHSSGMDTNKGDWGSMKKDHGAHSTPSQDWKEHAMMRDHREGRSYMSRKMYLEAKEGKGDKTSQLKELEKYMQELTSDIVDMIEEATLEEKQYLEKKISALATKIGQMK